MLKIRKKNPFYQLLRPIKRKLDIVFRSRRNILITILAILGIIYFGAKLRGPFIVVMLTLLGSISMMYLRYVPELYVLGVEFCMLATVVSASLYGSIVGGIVGLTTITAATLLSGRFKPNSFISILALPAIGIVTPFFNWDITLLGVAMTILYDAIILPLYVMTGSRIPSSIIFFISHVLFNYWVFDTLAPFILKLAYL